MKKAPIDTILKPINQFLKIQSIAGILLFLCAGTAILWANSPFKESYHHFWENYFTIRFADFEVSKTLHHWINDGLMSVFFFVVGLELKREIVGGELSSVKKAALPIGAAIGGMVIPAIIFIYFNHNSSAVSGWGIPMATDIAFALGVLMLLGKRVPLTIKLFLTALAITDDLGAVLVIAFFYTSDISLFNLMVGGGFLAILILANYLGVRNTLFYAITGIIGLWLAFLMSGVHATIAGVLAAFTIPASTKIDEIGFVRTLRNYTILFKNSPPNKTHLVTPNQLDIIQAIKKECDNAETPLQELEHTMHPLVSYIVVPIFALSNGGIEITVDILNAVSHPVTIGVALGLLLGKFIGVFGFSFLLVKLKFAELPVGTNWKHISGVAFLAGIGFTMSLFISELAFADPQMILQAKLGILVASVTAAIVGFVILYFTKKPEVLVKSDQEDTVVDS